jgi:cytochrome b561
MTDDHATRAYGPFAIFLHWAVAALILANLAIGWIGEEMERGPAKAALFQWHMSLGILVLLLSAVRLAWRRIEPPPPPITSVRWEAGLAKAVHAGLLAIALLGPVTGIAAQLAEGRPVAFFGIELAGGRAPAVDRSLFAPARADEDEDEAEEHGAVAGAGGERGEADEIWKGMHALLVKPALMLLLLLHVGGALKHHFVDHDDTLRRMLGRSARAAALRSPTLP